MLSVTFDINERGNSPESLRILEKFCSSGNELFITRWLCGEYSTQSTSALAAGKYILEHIKEYTNFLIDSDENEEKMIRTALLSAFSCNWIGSICKYPFSSEDVGNLIDLMLEQLSPAGNPWQVQTIQLLLCESFLSSVFYYIDDTVLEGLIADVVIPCLLDSHSDVQDASSQLLTFIVKSSLLLIEKLPYIVQIFITMLRNKESTAERIAGAKGLCAIISGTFLFNDVPQYVIDSFSALADALEMDSSVEGIITQFFSDFWALYDSNLMNGVAEILAPYRASLRPSYFC